MKKQKLDKEALLLEIESSIGRLKDAKKLLKIDEELSHRKGVYQCDRVVHNLRELIPDSLRF